MEVLVKIAGIGYLLYGGYFRSYFSPPSRCRSLYTPAACIELFNSKIVPTLISIQ
jgi:hypothetical protein